MIIESKIELPDLIKMQTIGDAVHFTHAQRIDPILQDCHNRRVNADPHHRTKGEWEKIASVPELEFFKHPELADHNELKKWLKKDGPDGGKQYRVSRRSI